MFFLKSEKNEKYVFSNTAYANQYQAHKTCGAMTAPWQSLYGRIIYPLMLWKLQSHYFHAIIIMSSSSSSSSSWSSWLH